MGLLDWLTDGIGSNGGGSNPMGDFTGGPSAPPLAPPMAPVQQTGTDVPPLPPPYPPGGDPMTAGGPPPNNFDPMTAGGAPPNGPGLPPSPPVPLPMARPPGANAPPPGPPPPLPPPGNGTNGVGPGLGVGAPPPGFSTAPLSPQDASGIAQSYQRAGGNLAPPAAPAGASGFIGRALGLDANREASMRGSLGAGLKAAGENAHKPGLAAFAGSMGSGIEGGKAATDKTTDQQSKYLNDAIKAQQAGDTGKLNIARTRLALAQAKAAESGKDTKAGAMNSPERLYLSGLKSVTDQTRGSLATLRATESQFGVGSKEAKAALATHNDLVARTKKTVFGTLGVSEKDAAKFEKEPGFSYDNPVKDFPKDEAAATKKFEGLPNGAYFINPKNGGINPKDGTPWLLIKQPPNESPAGASPTPQAQSPTPAAPVPVTAPAGSRADQEDDE